MMTYLFEEAGFFEALSNDEYKELVIHAATTNNFGLASILLTTKQDIQLDEAEFNRHMGNAIKKKFSRTVMRLLNNGEKLQYRSLFKAIYNDNYDFVKLILENGPTYKVDEYKESLYVAGRIGHLNAIKAIIDSNTAPQSAINHAIFGGAIMETSRL